MLKQRQIGARTGGTCETTHGLRVACRRAGAVWDEETVSPTTCCQAAIVVECSVTQTEEGYNSKTIISKLELLSLVRQMIIQRYNKHADKEAVFLRVIHSRFSCFIAHVVRNL